MMPPVQNSKTVLRAKMLEARSEMGPDKAGELNRALSKNILFVLAEAGVKEPRLGAPPAAMPLWAAYKSFRWEADPSSAMADTAHLVRWVYPRVVPGTTEFELLEPAARDARWFKNAWGIWEPDPMTSNPVSLDQCSGVLVPGVAFDRQGHRLGYGKGFYDRKLAGYTGLKVGVAFQMQIANDPLPFEAGDVPMDRVVTDSEIIRTQEQRH